MRFLKENSYDIVRLAINQIGITIFAWVLYSAVSSMDIEATMKILVSVFSTLFYFALIYSTSWEYGAKDKLKIDSGRLEYNRYKGFLLGLFANSFNIIFSAIDVILMGVFISSGVEQFKTVYAIIDVIIRFVEGIYIGVILSIVPSVNDTSYLLQSVCFTVAPFLAVGVTTVGYLFGAKNIRIFGVFSKKATKK